MKFGHCASRLRSSGFNSSYILFAEGLSVTAFVLVSTSAASIHHCAVCARDPCFYSTSSRHRTFLVVSSEVEPSAGDITNHVRPYRPHPGAHGVNKSFCILSHQLPRHTFSNDGRS